MIRQQWKCSWCVKSAIDAPPARLLGHGGRICKAERVSEPSSRVAAARLSLTGPDFFCQSKARFTSKPTIARNRLVIAETESSDFAPRDRV